MVTHQTTTNYEGTTVLCQADHFEKSFNGSMMRKPSTEYPYALNTRASLGADIFCVTYPQDNREGLGNPMEHCYVENQLHFLLKNTEQSR